jgi:hypothetical protein
VLAAVAAAVLDITGTEAAMVDTADLYARLYP